MVYSKIKVLGLIKHHPNNQILRKMINLCQKNKRIMEFVETIIQLRQDKRNSINNLAIILIHNKPNLGQLRLATTYIT